MEPIIKVRNLYVVYQKGTLSETTALNGVDIEIYPEELLIIYGPSGCGKSTLLYAISGIEEEIDKGEIWYKDRNIREMDKEESIMYHRQAIGMIFQGYQLIPTLKVLENVTLPLTFEGVPSPERKKRGIEQLEHFGLKAFEKNLPTELSGGQQQRVGIARALINNPEIILADEPTGNLDSEAAINVLSTLKELSKEMKKTVVVVTHESQYFPYADRIIFMKDGKVIDETKQGPNLKDTKVQPGNFFNQDQKNLHLHAIKTITFLGFNSAGEEYSRIEEAIRGYFEQKLTRDQLFEVLHKPIKKGGVGLYKQRAERLAGEVQEIVELNSMIRGVKDDEEKVANLKISYVTDWLLKVFHGHLSDSQKALLIDVVKDRIKGKISHSQMEARLDLAESKGGVGLNFHTGKNISQRLDVVLSS